MHRLVGIIAIALVCTTGFGARKYGMSGCGLGSYVVDPDAGGFAHAFGYTTNGTIPGGAFFPIISGTSNCEPDEGDKKAEYQESFISHNFASLSKEMTQGQGETLIAFTETLGCSQDVVPMAHMQLKANASEILAAPGAVAALETAKDVLGRNPQIGKSCKFLS